MSMSEMPVPLEEEVKQAEIFKSEEMKIEFPYNLNNLFNMNYSFETLKKSIEYLAK
jgi:hypothetical protein